MSRVFTATLDAVTSNKSKTTIKLSLSNKEAAIFAQRYLTSIDKELQVQFEDPQLEMKFQQQQDGRPGLVATVNGRGEVEDVQRDADGHDEDDAQGDLFPQDGAGGIGDGTATPDPKSDIHYEGTVNDQGVIRLGYLPSWNSPYDNKETMAIYLNRVVWKDKPFEATYEDEQHHPAIWNEEFGDAGIVRGYVWRKEDGTTGLAANAINDSDTMDFEDAGNAMDPDPEGDSADPEIDREKLEEYILEEKPTFDDIPFNFPMLLRRRRDENITWKDLAMEASTSTIRLQNFYTDYKQRVASKMKADGVA